MGQLTTHVLDTANGRPGAGMRLTLFRLMDGERRLITSATTNADGRCDSPLLHGAELDQGVYELAFEAGAYFSAQGVVLPDPPFLDQIVLRFGIADAAADYHVPLLVSPWSYSTYRGS
jgi:5-hydroxyisourate hydrolase